MSDLQSIINLGASILFYALIGGITVFSAMALFIINKHGEHQSTATITSVVYIALFLILVTSAFSTLQQLYA